MGAYPMAPEFQPPTAECLGFGSSYWSRVDRRTSVKPQAVWTQLRVLSETAFWRWKKNIFSVGVQLQRREEGNLKLQTAGTLAV